MEAIIQATAIDKTYTVGAGVVSVLKRVTVTVGTGEAVAIMGPSGAGKSTLLHVLGGLDAPSGGRVLFKGQDLYALPPAVRTQIRARQIGFVFQSYHLLPELDVIENVELPAMPLPEFWRRKSVLRQRALELLEAVGLANRIAHTPLELSGGEQQRVALARALMNEPEMLLADEPTGNLDTDTGEQVLRCLFQLTKTMKHTLVIVTHNAEVAARCDRTLRLVDGRVQD